MNFDELFELYLADMKEHLELLNESLLKLDKCCDDKEIINDIFRSFHTMKGSTAAMCFNHCAETLHHMEDLLQEMREGRITVSPELINLLFACHDFIDKFVHQISTTNTEEGIECSDILGKLDQYFSKQTKLKETSATPAEKKKNIEGLSLDPEELQYIREKISSGFRAYNVNIKISDDCIFLAVRAFMVYNELEQTAEILKTSPKQPTDEDFASDSFKFEDREIKAVILSEKEAEEIYKHLVMTLSEIDAVEVEEYSFEQNDPVDIVDSIIEKDNDFWASSASGYIKADNQKSNEETKSVENNEQLLHPDNHFGKKENLKNSKDDTIHPSNETQEQKHQSFIRVQEQKVDSLVDMLGELLIIQSLHKQELSDLLSETNKSDSRINNSITRMERVTKDLQTIAMSLRMVSLKQCFQKLARIGHDTALELKKDINITISGDETEIDRSIVEKIQDPLMHLVRNSISHGIEAKEDRISKGKAPQGQVNINAYNKRGFVFIEISDDGKGMSVENIYAKAKEKCLIDPNKNYTNEEIIRFIYLPGFSTQDVIDNVSGRGVGMNVVETEITKIGGKIEVSNQYGLGCKFILKIPINLATINGTIVDIFESRYIIPTHNIKQLLKPDLSQLINIKGNTDMIKIRDSVMPIIPIDKILNNDSKKIDFSECMIVVLELDHKLKALPVSGIINKQEIVVKPLGPEFRNLDFVTGATILGDGRVSLILDIESLF